MLNLQSIVAEYDAAALVIGLPLTSNGGEGMMSREAREMARKFTLSLQIPVYLQDERVTSYEAKARLWDRGIGLKQSRKMVDSEAATIILADILDRLTDSGQRLGSS